MTWQQKNYYTNSKTTKGLDGSYYASMFECSYANELYARKKNKEIENYETQVPFPLIVNGYKCGNYIADFVIMHLDGSDEIVETKGFATPLFRLKWQLVEAIYNEDYKITLLMQGKGNVRHPKKVIEF